jgi:alpha-glucosidase (family GH31 glycosyl hydrolase)
MEERGDPPGCDRRWAMIRRLAFYFLLLSVAAAETTTRRAEFKIEPGEYWWGGLSVDGRQMPYGETVLFRDLEGDDRGNQAQPLLISSHGRYVWSEQPFAYRFSDGTLTVTTKHGPIESGRHGRTLAEAYSFVSRNYFPASGKLPEPLMFTRPQYNTWIELMYDQNEAGILKYAQSIVDHGYPPGVLMIDDNWQEDYGTWEFSARRFSNPKAMIARLHQLGFKVMLWVVPFVSPDSAVFRDLSKRGLLLLEQPASGKAEAAKNAALIRWWNGASAVLDFSNPKAVEWFDGRLKHLTSDYGVDGYKFDAGDAEFYTGKIVSFKPSLANDQTNYFARIGLQYPLNEYRVSWKLAGQPLGQRLRDKRHSWEDLQELIPGIIAQGLMGYPFTCPDLIGGGEFQSFLDAATVDQELMVRSAEVSALMPMMQFSVAPWRVLDGPHAAMCKRMALLHAELGPEILRLAQASAQSGEPIVRALAYAYPDSGYEKIEDEFLLGPDILVAPVVTRNARSRTIVFPRGTWKGDDGSTIVGPRTVETAVPLDRLPWYRRVDTVK